MDQISDELRKLLKARFALEEFRTGQLDILRSILAGKDTLAVMPTGGGKSLCYQIPAVYRPGIVVVISPLIALMKDQIRFLHSLQIPAGALHSGQEYDEKRRIFAEMTHQENFILYVSPERVQKPGFASWIASKKISLFAIDE